MMTAYQYAGYGVCPGCGREYEDTELLIMHIRYSTLLDEDVGVHLLCRTCCNRRGHVGARTRPTLNDLRAGTGIVKHRNLLTFEYMPRHPVEEGDAWIRGRQP